MTPGRKSTQFCNANAKSECLRRSNAYPGKCRVERQGEPPGLGQNIYRRLSQLKKLVEDLQANGDSYGQIVNANAIMDAYRAGTLRDWPGLITYWSNGRRLCEPRPFDWDEFEAINRANNGDMSFFTEGVSLVSLFFKKKFFYCLFS